MTTCTKHRSYCRTLPGGHKARAGKECDARGGKAGTRVSSYYSPKRACPKSIMKRERSRKKKKKLSWSPDVKTPKLSRRALHKRALGIL